MQKCPACGVRIDGERKRCPLCGRTLTDAPAGEENTGVFPLIPPHKTYHLIFKISTFAAIFILIVVNILHGVYLPHMPIYMTLTLSTVCAWIIINVGVRRRKSIPKGILCEGLIGVLLCLLWDRLTGWYGWSWRYVLPVTFAALGIFYFVMGMVDRRRLSTYAGYFLISALGMAAVAVLFFTGHTDGVARHFAVICMGVTVSLLAAQIVFRGKLFLSEVNRWVHM